MFGSNFYCIGDLALPDDAEEFYEWLMDLPRDKFPLKVFVEGTTFEFKTDTDALYFCLGWEVRRDLGF